MLGVTLGPQRQTNFKSIDEPDSLYECMKYGSDNLFLQQATGPFNVLQFQ